MSDLFLMSFKVELKKLIYHLTLHFFFLHTNCSRQNKNVFKIFSEIVQSLNFQSFEFIHLNWVVAKQSRSKDFSVVICIGRYILNLNRFMPLVSFYTPEKQKTLVFVMFSSVMKRNQWHETGLNELVFLTRNNVKKAASLPKQ